MPNNTTDRIDELRSRLLLLKKRDGLLKTSGAWTFNCGHRYRLNTILRDWHIEEIESKYNFSLPNDYREYLQRIGNGGAGPCYGLFTLEESLLYDPETLSAEFLSSPFPLEAAFNPFLFCLSWTLSEIDELEYSSPPGVHDVQPQAIFP